MCALLTPAITQPGVLKPKKGLIILGAIILGLMLSIVGVLLRSLFNRGMERPAGAGRTRYQRLCQHPAVGVAESAR